jgi:hypothetical protein
VKSVGQPEQENDEQDEQSALPPRGSRGVKACILCELNMLRDVPLTSRRLLRVVFVAREGLIRSGGHGRRCVSAFDYLSAACFFHHNQATIG